LLLCVEVSAPAAASSRTQTLSSSARQSALTDSIDQFLAMGGYAAFVWPAYAVAALVMLGLLVVSLRRLRRTQAALDAGRGATAEGRR
jgi:heme exporter protein D